MVLTKGMVDAVWGDVDGEGFYGALQLMGLDVVEAPHRSCVGAPLADPHGVRPRRRRVQAVCDNALDCAVMGSI